MNGIDATIVGALVSTVYILGETIKSASFSKRRKEESEKFECKLREFDNSWLDKYICQFSGQGAKMDHILNNQGRKEMILESLKDITENNERKFEKIIDKFEDLTNEIHENNIILKQFIHYMGRGEHKKI